MEDHCDDPNCRFCADPSLNAAAPYLSEDDPIVVDPNAPEPKMPTFLVENDGVNPPTVTEVAGGEPPTRMCVNGHPFVPGTTVDNDPPSDLWCDVCGETVSVQGNVDEWTPEDHAAFAAIVRAAEAKYASDHPDAVAGGEPLHPYVGKPCLAEIKPIQGSAGWPMPPKSSGSVVLCTNPRPCEQHPRDETDRLIPVAARAVVGGEPPYVAHLEPAPSAETVAAVERAVRATGLPPATKVTFEDDVAGGEPTRPSAQEWDLAAIRYNVSIANGPTPTTAFAQHFAPLIERERADAAARVVKAVEAWHRDTTWGACICGARLPCPTLVAARGATGGKT